MSGLPYTTPPNPENSPNEKLEVTRRLMHAQLSADSESYLRGEGVEPQLARQIGAVLDRIKREQNFQVQQILEELEVWSNIHTHPRQAGGDGGIGLSGDAQWVRLADLTWDAAAPGVVLLDGTIYVFGGGVSNDTYGYYNIATDTWTLIGAMPRERTGPAAVVSGLGIHLIGGGDTAHDLYDPATDTWTTLATSPGTGGFYTKAQRIEDAIYKLASNALYRYDLDLDSWSTLSSASVAVNGPAFGGTAALGVLLKVAADLEIYDLSGDSWSLGTAPPYDHTDAPAGGMLGDKLYVVGGSTLASAALDEYDFLTDTWLSRDPIPIKDRRWGMAFDEVTPALYVVGGDDDGFTLFRYS